MLCLTKQLRTVMRTPPLQFQVDGIRFLENRHGRAIIGDDMGLGKTYQAIAYLSLHPELRPAAIICPATLKLNWQHEMQKHSHLRPAVLSGTKPYTPTGEIWIINYDILWAWAECLAESGLKCVILDEFQRIKNRAAKRTRAAQIIARNKESIIGLSGTPISNCPVEFYPILNLIAPQDFPSFWSYAFHYCAPKRAFQGRGWDFSGASNLDELHTKVKKYMIRRMKESVLSQLPPKLVTVIPIEINRTEYNAAESHFLKWLSLTKGPEFARRAASAEALVKLGQLKQLAAKGKLKMVIEWVNDWLVDNPGQKLVLFAVHHEIINNLSDALGKRQHPHVIVTGKTPATERQQAINAFQQNGGPRIFIGSIRAAGEGITLTTASTVVFVELGWTPTEHEQAEDRIIRIGQTAKKINVVYCIANDTIESKLLELLDRKRNIIDQVLDGHSTTNMQLELVNILKQQEVKQ